MQRLRQLWWPEVACGGRGGGEQAWCAQGLGLLHSPSVNLPGCLSQASATCEWGSSAFALAKAACEGCLRRLLARRQQAAEEGYEGEWRRLIRCCKPECAQEAASGACCELGLGSKATWRHAKALFTND